MMLSANQGKVLNDKIGAINSNLTYNSWSQAFTTSDNNKYSCSATLYKVNNMVFGTIQMATKSGTTLSAWTNYTICNKGSFPAAFRATSVRKIISSQQNGAGEFTILTDGTIQYKPWETMKGLYATGNQFAYKIN